MKIIDRQKFDARGTKWHVITAETVDKSHIAAIFFKAAPTTTYISLIAAAKIAGVSETGLRDHLRKHGERPTLFTVPARVNGTGQARKMAFINALDVWHLLLQWRHRESGVRTWFYELAYFTGDNIPAFHGGNDLTGAEITEDAAGHGQGLLGIPDLTVRVDFDATNGIKELNRVISSLDVPYQVRARALAIQNDFSQLAKIIETLNTTGKAE